MADNKTQIIITAKDDTRAAIASVHAGLTTMTSQAAALGLQMGALAGFASAGAFSLMAKQAIDAADAIGKMSQKIGITAESLSALNYAGKLSDVSMEQLSTGLKKLSVNLNEMAAGGSNDAGAALKALGISATDAEGKLRSADDVFSDISDAFESMKDSSGKTALAVALFGRAGADLIPMLNQGREGLRGAADEASAFGLIVGGEAAKAAEEFNDNLTRLSAASEGVGQKIAGDLLPPLSELAKEMVEGAKSGTGLTNVFGGALKTTLEAVVVLGANVAYVFKQIGVEIGGMAAQLAALARLDFNQFKLIGEAMREDAQKARAEVDAFSNRVLNPTSQLPFSGRSRVGAGEKSDAPIFSSSAGKSAAAQITEGERLIQQLRDRLLATQDLNEVERLEAQFADEKYKKITTGERETALAIAGQIDLRKQINTELDEELKRIEAINKANESDAARLASLIGATDSGKDAQRMMDENFMARQLGEGRVDLSVYNEVIAKLREVKTEGKTTFDELKSAIDGWGKQSAKAIADFAISGKGSFSDLTKSILSDIGQMMIYSSIKPFFDNISSKNTGVGSLLSGLFGGGRATGGPVNPGEFYVVGEKGPEILVPGTSGTVIPNGATGGGSTNVSISIDASGTRSEGDAGSAKELARRLDAAVRNVLMSEKRPGGLLA